MSKIVTAKLMVRLPIDVKEWLAEQAAWNASSQSSEVVKAIRAEMDRSGRPGGSLALATDR